MCPFCISGTIAKAILAAPIKKKNNNSIGGTRNLGCVVPNQFNPGARGRRRGKKRNMGQMSRHEAEIANQVEPLQGRASPRKRPERKASDIHNSGIVTTHFKT